jgi:multiple sugar transport system ATP-binding protein
MALASDIAVMNKGRQEQVGAPGALYDQPTSRFVAEFIGSHPINIFGDNDQTQAIADQWRTLIPDAQQTKTFGVRPESWTLQPSAAFQPPSPETEHLHLMGKIVSVLAFGGTWVIELAAQQARIAIEMHTPPNFAHGDEVSAMVAKDRILAFDH